MGVGTDKGTWMPQILVLDDNPKRAAEAMCDTHVNRLFTDTVQLLTNELRRAYGVDKLPMLALPHAFEQTYAVLWLRHNVTGLVWLHEHACALAKQYRLRYAHDQKCTQYLQPITDWLNDTFNLTYLNQIRGVGPAYYPVGGRGMQEKYPDLIEKYTVPGPGYRMASPNRAVSAYREFYLRDKPDAKWRHGVNPPSWWVGEATTQVAA